MVETSKFEFTGLAIAACKFSWFEKHVPDFIQRRKLDILEMSKALESDNFDQIAKVCHQIRGSADSFGFPGLSIMATQLETAANEHNDEHVKEILMKLFDLSNWSMSC